MDAANGGAQAAIGRIDSHHVRGGKHKETLIPQVNLDTNCQLAILNGKRSERTVDVLHNWPNGRER